MSLSFCIPFRMATTALAAAQIPANSAVVPVWHARGNADGLRQKLGEPTDTPFQTVLQFSAHPDDSDFTVISVVVPEHEIIRFTDWDGYWQSSFQTMISHWERILNACGIRGLTLRAYWIDRSLRSYIISASVTG